MSENTNLVQTWAKNIKDDAQCAIESLAKVTKIEPVVTAISKLCEIKGACEAIISAVGGGAAEEINNCKTCAFGKEAGGHTRCTGCLDGNGNAKYWVAPNKEAAKQHQPNDHTCDTCRNQFAFFAARHCDACVNGGGLFDMWVAK